MTISQHNQLPKTDAKPLTLEEVVSLANLDPTLTERQREVIGVADLSLDLDEASRYDDDEAAKLNAQVKTLERVISGLLAARDQYVTSAETLEEQSPETADKATDLRLMFETASVLNKELDVLKAEEVGLADLVDSLERTFISCQAALEQSRQSIINSSMYSDEQPTEAFEEAALEIAKNDSSDLLTQTAALTITGTKIMLEQGLYNLQQLRFRIETKQQELDELVQQANQIAAEAIGSNAETISTVNSLKDEGLRALGEAIIALMEGNGEDNLLSEGLTRAELDS